eukprot:TRINITY_DN4003_c0_g1_i1.p1 TRINITY_DN4003_c0_g1~~TRINITY_DN4003_c0_g1_i1.p1  ORF type:complete len:342 (-),score=119.44 TRINITY_DN4003_c0_g1_i1:56-1081(-)
MAALLRVAGIAALLSVAAAEEHSSLRAAPSQRRKHHRHHKQHPAAPGVAQQHQQLEQPQLLAAGSESERFASIQTDLMEAWKERTHLEQLQQTIDSQKALLGQQKRLIAQRSEAVSEEERTQYSTVAHMVRDSKAMVSKIRQAAIKKIKDAMSNVMSIDEAASSDMEENKRRIEAAKAEIARANAADAKDQQIKQRSQKVLAAAVQEAKYFQSMLSKKKVEEGTNKTQVSTQKIQQQNEVSKEKAQKAELKDEEVSKEDPPGAEKDVSDQMDEGKAQKDGRTLPFLSSMAARWSSWHSVQGQKEEATQEKVQKEDAPDDAAHIKKEKESLLAVYQQAMHEE